MKETLTTKCTNELISLLEELIGFQDVLHGTIREKLAAMRRCDSAAIMAAAHREGEIVSSISTLDERRHQIVGELCAALGMNRPVNTKNVTLRSLAGRLGANSGPRLQKIADLLREKMLSVAEANRVAELVTQEMMTHFKILFMAFVGGDNTAPTYSNVGAVRMSTGPKMLDAVG